MDRHWKWEGCAACTKCVGAGLGSLVTVELHFDLSVSINPIPHHSGQHVQNYVQYQYLLAFWHPLLDTQCPEYVQETTLISKSSVSYFKQPMIPH